MFPIVAALILSLLALASIWALIDGRVPAWQAAVVAALGVVVFVIALLLAVAFAPPIFTAP